MCKKASRKKQASVIILVIFILAGAFFYLNYHHSRIIERIQIEPFGLKFGNADVEFVINNSVGEKKYNYAFSTPFPTSEEVYNRLPNKGFCRREFGTKLLDNSRTHILPHVPNPLFFNSFLDDRINYEVSINPVMGIFKIEAVINPPTPKGPNWNNWRWANFVYDEVSKKILPIMEKKYSTFLDNPRLDMEGREILASVTQKENNFYDNTITSVSYRWSDWRLDDWINNSETIFARNLRLCINEKKKIYRSLSDKQELERQIEKEKQKRNENILKEQSIEKLNQAL